MSNNFYYEWSDFDSERLYTHDEKQSLGKTLFHLYSQPLDDRAYICIVLQHLDDAPPNSVAWIFADGKIKIPVKWERLVTQTKLAVEMDLTASPPTREDAFYRKITKQQH